MKDRKASDQKWREGVRRKAAELGMSVKAYRASQWPSALWSYVVEVIRKRCKKSGVECSITPALLAGLWDTQGGICPLTGWEMTPRKSGSGLEPRVVSVDRIEQSKGYVPGNVRLVAFAANNARYVWSDATLIELAEAITRQAEKETK